MIWLRQRLPYLVLVVFAFVAFSVHSDDISRVRSEEKTTQATQAELKATVARLDSVFATGTRGSCIARNDLRDGLVSFVAESTQRSANAAAATIASPTATADQKRVAASNLAQITAGLARLRTELPLQHCPGG